MSDSLRALLAQAGHMLRKSGPAPDCAFILRLLEREGPLRTLLLRWLRLRVSPDALPRMRTLAAPLDERARLFRQAVSLLNVNETYKTTGSDRTRLADETILGLIADPDTGLAEAKPLRLLDIGVSDGSASVALLSRLPEGTEVILTDLHPVLYARGPGLCRVFLDGQRRLLGVKVLGLYLNLSLDARRDATGYEAIDTLNPLLRERLGVAELRPFDAMSDVLGAPAHVIKCANVLNLGYFSGAAILAATANLARSLVEGGFLVLSQNNASYRDGEACIVLRKSGQRLLLAGQTNGHAALPLFTSDTDSKEGGTCASS